MKNEIFCINKINKQKKKINIPNLFHNKIFKICKIQKSSLWTKAEDKILLELGQKTNKNKWKFNCSILKDKTSYQCYLRYKKINPNIKKGRWNENEDKQLLYLVNVLGKSWKSIAKIMKNRTNKQIRNRYEEHICENLNKGIFTNEEDEKLISLYKLFKKNWSDYKKYFIDRSIKRIKSRIIYLINRKGKIRIRKNDIIKINNNIYSEKNSLVEVLSTDYSLKENNISDENIDNLNIGSNGDIRINTFRGRVFLNLIITLYFNKCFLLISLTGLK